MLELGGSEGATPDGKFFLNKLASDWVKEIKTWQSFNIFLHRYLDLNKNNELLLIIRLSDFEVFSFFCAKHIFFT